MIEIYRTKGRAGEIDKYIGKQLKLFRTLAGISQDKLANEVGVSFQQIQKNEMGTNRVSAGRIYEFSQILNRDIDDFFDGYDGKYKNKEMKNLHSLPPESLKMIHKLMEIKNKDHQRAAIQAAYDVISLYSKM